MERVYWDTVEFNNHAMFLVATQKGIKFVSNPALGISQIYNFYRHQSFEFKYQASITSDYQRILTDYLGGDRLDQPVPFDLKGGGDQFALQVWRLVRRIPYGEVRTVKQLADQLQTSAASVETAIKSNPVLILIPTHRVIVSSQKLGRFRESLSMKSQLLEIETIMRNVED